MQWLGLAILLAATWLYAVGHAQLAPDPFLIEHAEQWSAWLARTGMAQTASVLILMAGMWRAAGGRWLAVWLGLSFQLGWSQWLLTSDWPTARAHLGFALLWLLLCLLRPRFAAPALILLPGGVAGLVGFVVGKKLSDVYTSSQPGRWSCGRLPWRGMVAIATAVLTVVALKPVEEWFNRDLLIAAQKRHISIGEAARPNPLPWWVERLGATLEVGPDDVKIAEWLRTQPTHLKTMVVTPGRRVESRDSIRILSALAGGRPFAGWLPGAANEMTPTAKKLREELGHHETAGLDLLVVRGKHAKKPENLQPLFQNVYGLSAAPLGFQEDLETKDPIRPGGKLRVQARARAAAKIASLDPPFQVLNPGPNTIGLPFTPGTYPLGNRQIEIQPGELKVVLGIPSTLPSRSLVPIMSHWSGNGVALEAYRGVRLRCGPLASPIQPIAGELPRDLILWFSTPELEAEETAVLEMITESGQAVAQGTFSFRTWRRLPPKGF